MPSPLTTLVLFVAQLSDLDMTQDWIDNARIAAPTNPIVQQSLNRRQIEVDVKRARIEIMLEDIASRN